MRTEEEVEAEFCKLNEIDDESGLSHDGNNAREALLWVLAREDETPSESERKRYKFSHA